MLNVMTVTQRCNVECYTEVLMLHRGVMLNVTQRCNVECYDSYTEV